MKNLMKAAVITLFLSAGPSWAEPVMLGLEGPIRGSVVTPAAGQIEVVSSGDHQYLKFSEEFSVASQAETEIRHLDGQTGAITVIGKLISRNGYQVYEVPERLKIDGDDQIVLYSPLHADDLATVELSED
jgi:hypothetical protein